MQPSRRAQVRTQLAQRYSRGPMQHSRTWISLHTSRPSSVSGVVDRPNAHVIAKLRAKSRILQRSVLVLDGRLTPILLEPHASPPLLVLSLHRRSREPIGGPTHRRMPSHAPNRQLAHSRPNSSSKQPELSGLDSRPAQRRSWKSLGPAAVAHRTPSYGARPVVLLVAVPSTGFRMPRSTTPKHCVELHYRTQFPLELESAAR